MTNNQEELREAKRRFIDVGTYGEDEYELAKADRKIIKDALELYLEIAPALEKIRVAHNNLLGRKIGSEEYLSTIEAQAPLIAEILNGKG